MAWLNLYSNRLSGSIPSELGNLTNLEELYLSGNELRGCVPAAWRNVENNDLDSLGLPFCVASSSTDAVTAGAADRKMLVARYPAAEPGKPPADNAGRKAGKLNSTNKAEIASRRLRG